MPGLFFLYLALGVVTIPAIAILWCWLGWMWMLNYLGDLAYEKYSDHLESEL